MTRKQVEPVEDGPPPKVAVAGEAEAEAEAPAHITPEGDLVTLMSPGPEGQDPAMAFRMEGGSVWLLQDEAGAFYAYRSLPMIEGWLKLPEGVTPSPASEGSPALPLVGPDGLPFTVTSLGQLGVPEPPSGTHSDVYALPTKTDALYAATPGGDYRLSLTENAWESLAPPAPPQEIGRAHV